MQTLQLMKPLDAKIFDMECDISESNLFVAFCFNLKIIDFNRLMKILECKFGCSQELQI